MRVFGPTKNRPPCIEAFADPRSDNLCANFRNYFGEIKTFLAPNNTWIALHKYPVSDLVEELDGGDPAVAGIAGEAASSLTCSLTLTDRINEKVK